MTPLIAVSLLIFGVISVAPASAKSIASTSLGRSSNNNQGETRAGTKDRGTAYTGGDQPPPVFDWLSEPPRIVDTGKAWLVPGPIQDVQVELCTVVNPSSLQSEEDESDEGLEDYGTDNLFCPTGYRCQVDHIGDPDKGIPDSGHCVLEDGVEIPEDIADDSVPKTTCLFEGITYDSGDTFRFQNNNCFCMKGEVDCIVY